MIAAKNRKTGPRARVTAKKPSAPLMSGQEFDALPDSEREKFYDWIEQTTPEQRRAQSVPLTPNERAQWNRFIDADRKKRRGSAGRPKLGPRGRGVKVISLSVEKDLLDQADAYARRHGMKRAEFFSSAICAAMSLSPVDAPHR